MSHRAAIAALALLLAACAHHRPAVPEAARGPLELRQHAFVAALAARDADALGALFAEDAVLHVAGMPAIEGRPAIRDLYRKMFGFLAGSAAVFERMHVSDAGDMAYSIGRATNEFRGPQGPVTYAGKFSLIWRHRAGEWVVVVYSVSSDQPDPGRGP
jgi:ketosteroid isomerase-like protein